jgi:hypothetical protein
MTSDDNREPLKISELIDILKKLEQDRKCYCVVNHNTWAPITTICIKERFSYPRDVSPEDMTKNDVSTILVIGEQRF